MKNNLDRNFPLLVCLLSGSFILGAVTILIATRALPKIMTSIMCGMMRKMEESGEMPEMCRRMMQQCSKISEKSKS